MKTRQNRNLVLFLGGLGGLVTVLVIGANYLLRLVPVEPPPASQLLPVIQAEDTDEDTAPSSPVFRIQSGTVDHRPVGYTAEGFSPPRITIQETDSIGCLITVLNRSDVALRVGVSPHEAAGDPGADYGIIAPGASAVLDVRYTGLPGITLHNHARPEHEFTVTYASGCK